MARVDNIRRQAVALTLRNELEMNNTQIGRYYNLHSTSVSKLIRHGNTNHAK